MIDNEEDQLNIVSFGFTDVLIGFLISTFLLMLIVKYGFNAGGEVAGQPKNYFIYEAEISATQGSGLDIDNGVFQITVRTPQGERVESIVSESGNVYNDNFIKFTKNDFYALGPSKKKNKENSRFYTLYGAINPQKSGKLKIGIRYVHNTLLTDSNRDSNLPLMKRVVNNSFTVNHELRHALLEKDEPPIEELNDKLDFGHDCVMEVAL